MELGSVSICLRILGRISDKNLIQRNAPRYKATERSLHGESHYKPGAHVAEQQTIQLLHGLGGCMAYTCGSATAEVYLELDEQT